MKTTALFAILLLGCSSSDGGSSLGQPGGGSSSGNPPSGDSGAPPTDGGTTQNDGGTTPPPPACAPAVAKPAWTSPYAGFTRGIPTDPTFFPIAVWLQGASHIQEYSKMGVNVLVGNGADVNPLAAKDLDTLKGLGMYAIVGQDSLGLQNVDHPAIVGWFLADEPDNAQSDGKGGYGPPIAPATIVDQYKAIKAKDGTRPVFLGLGQGVAYDYEGRGSNPPPEQGYVPGSDVISFDIYPYNNCGGDTNVKQTCAEFWMNAFGVDQLRKWSDHGQAVWTDFETTPISADSPDGPTPAQTASEIWLALIHGANGIDYFVHTWNPTFREDGIFNHPDMVTAVTALNQQIKSLAPILNSGNVANLVSVTSSVSIETMVKVDGNTVYVFSAIAKSGTTTGAFAIAGLTGNATATVVGENRTVAVAGGKFSDDFGANAVHVYQIDLSKVICN
jgi:hypothetical protein